MAWGAHAAGNADPATVTIVSHFVAPDAGMRQGWPTGSRRACGEDR